jgi:hypothetical protein
MEEREADDGGRTRDLELGKLALYQLSYVRAESILRSLAQGRLNGRKAEGLTSSTP